MDEGEEALDAALDFEIERVRASNMTFQPLGGSRPGRARGSRPKCAGTGPKFPCRPQSEADAPGRPKRPENQRAGKPAHCARRAPLLENVVLGAGVGRLAARRPSRGGLGAAAARLPSGTPTAPALAPPREERLGRLGRLGVDSGVRCPRAQPTPAPDRPRACVCSAATDDGDADQGAESDGAAGRHCRGSDASRALRALTLLRSRMPSPACVRLVPGVACTRADLAVCTRRTDASVHRRHMLTRMSLVGACRGMGTAELFLGSLVRICPEWGRPVAAHAERLNPRPRGERPQMAGILTVNTLAQLDFRKAARS